MTSSRDDDFEDDDLLEQVDDDLEDPRGRPRRRRLPPMSVFPTLCTLGNLVAGFAAIHYASKPLSYVGPWDWSGLFFAGVLIFIGMIFDAVDGALARLTRSTTELGAQLDSLADIVTFGVAPAFMTVMLVGHYLGESGTDYNIIGPEVDNAFGRIVWAIAATYVCCAALRLARFNVETPTAAAEDHMIFRGLPSPGAAGAVASLILLHQELASSADVSATFVRMAALFVPMIMILCAFAMVSSMPYSHVINRYLRGRKSFAYIVYIVVPLMVLIWWYQFLAALVFCVYALSAPMQYGWRAIRRWQQTGAADKAAKAKPSTDSDSAT
jgi:CDP-diacylglycerol--serine O-phosphatidyltransferase